MPTSCLIERLKQHCAPLRERFADRLFESICDAIPDVVVRGDARHFILDVLEKFKPALALIFFTFTRPLSVHR
jgi:hypothetical protein